MSLYNRNSKDSLLALLTNEERRCTFEFQIKESPKETRFEFFKRFVQKPMEIGAICPSSSCLAKTIVSDIAIEDAMNIVEIGPGTGAFTTAILDNMHNDASFFVIELNEGLHKNFQKQFPNVKSYNKCASELAGIMKKEEKIDSIDAVISGLPWASFSESLQIKILDSIYESLEPGGAFVTFAYLQGFLLKGAHSFRALLKKKFVKVEISRIVWCNLPPAFVYRCRKS